MAPAVALVLLAAPAAPLGGSDERRLAPGALVDNVLSGQETHVFSVPLKAGQYFRAVLRQDGADLALALVSPDGALRIESDFADEPEGVETLSTVAEVEGDFRLEVRSNRPEGGKYALSADPPRPPGAADRDRIAAEALLREGERFRKQGTAEALERAVSRFERAAALWGRLPDRFFEALSLYRAGTVQHQLSRHREAVARLGQALGGWRSLHLGLFEAKALQALGRAHYYVSQYDKALEHYTAALSLRRAGGDPHGEADVLLSLGAVHGAMGQLERSLSYAEQALARKRALGEKRGEVTILHNIGVAYRQLGRIQKALDLLHEALPISRRSGDPRDEPAILGSLATVYSNLGDRQQSLHYSRRALELWRAIGDRSGEVSVLVDIGAEHFALGETAVAIRYYEQALALHRELGDGAEHHTLLKLAATHRRTGDRARAIELAREALRGAEAVSHPLPQAEACSALGQLHADGGELGAAVDYHRRALALFRTLGEREGEALSLFELARIDARQDALAPAREKLEAALGLLEAVRDEVGAPDLRASFGARAAKVREAYLDVLMRHHERDPRGGWLARAFEASERSRAHSLVEMLTESRPEVREGVDPELRERARALQAQLAVRLEQQMRLSTVPHEGSQAAAAEAAVEALRGQYRQVQAQLRAAGPRYAALQQPPVLGFAEVQERILDPHTLLLEYALGEERSFLFAVSSTTLHAYALPGRAAIEGAVARARDLMAAPPPAAAGPTGAPTPDPSRLKDALAALGRILLGPVARDLGGRRLVVVADGGLQYLPFAVLPSPERPGLALIETHEVVAVPSASLVAVLRAEAARRKPAQKTAIVFADPVFDRTDERLRPTTLSAMAAPGGRLSGDLTRAINDAGLQADGIPRLPFTRREANGIVALAPGARLAVDFEASRTNATSAELADYRFVHFATHGFLNSVHPELSGLVLSLFDGAGAPQDGFLSANDVFNLKLAADLVVLSGCRTALGRQVEGEGVVGLTRAFMYAGTPRVLASLWKVDDAATAKLMTRLYEGLLREGLSPAAALRQAQLALARDKRFAFPYYWAGFQLQGDWN